MDKLGVQAQAGAVAVLVWSEDQSLNPVLCAEPGLRAVWWNWRPSCSLRRSWGRD